MTDIRTLLRSASRRLFLNRLVQSLFVSLTAALSVVFVLVVTERVLGLQMPWTPTLSVVGGVALVWSLGWAWFGRPSEQRVAQVVDERAELRESISTALCVEDDNSPWSKAVVETARERAARVVLRDALPIEGPRLWPVPVAAAVAVLVSFFLLPKWDMLGKLEEQRAQAEQEREIQEASVEARETAKLVEEIMADANIEPGELDAELGPRDDAALDRDRPEADPRREALKKLTAVTDRIAEKQTGPEAQKLEALEQQLGELKTPGKGPAMEFSRQLARGNFKAAKAELENLAAKLADGSMEDEQRQQLQEQLEQLGQQLQQLGDQQAQLQQMLQQAGLTAEQAQQAASDPQQLQQALQNNPNLTDEQKQQLQQQAEAMAEACEQCNGLGQGMQQMAQAMQAGQQAGQQGGQQGGMNEQAMQAAGQMGDQLSQLEMLQQQMAGLDASMQQAQAQMAKLGQSMGQQGWSQGKSSGQGMTGAWRAGRSTQNGSGSGGPGRGNGAGPEAQAGSFTLIRERTAVTDQGGPIIAETLVWGNQIRGESQQAYAAVVNEAVANASSEALDEQLVPREFHDAVKGYFGNLKARVDDAGEQGNAQNNGESNGDDEG